MAARTESTKRDTSQVLGIVLDSEPSSEMENPHRGGGWVQREKTDCEQVSV